MILNGFLAFFLVSSCWAADQTGSDDEIPLVVSSQQGSSNDEIPFVVVSQMNSDEQKVSNLLPDLGKPDLPPVTSAQSPDNRGRSDIEIEEEKRFGGYVYPKPEQSFNLPPFKTLDAQLDGLAYFAEENTERERIPRSPRRRPPHFHSPPPFIPGFIPPNHIRPLPALYGRPQRY